MSNSSNAGTWDVNNASDGARRIGGYEASLVVWLVFCLLMAIGGYFLSLWNQLASRACWTGFLVFTLAVIGAWKFFSRRKAEVVHIGPYDKTLSGGYVPSWMLA